MTLLSEWRSTEERLFTLVGDAGTGKTTLLSELPAHLTHFCAPTGKAADVMRNKGVPASTIHKLIYHLTPNGFVRNKSLPKPIIAIDEGSMISADIWKDILMFDKKVVVIGDPNQLPPVGRDPRLFHDPSFRLTEIHRNAADSPIIKFSQELRDHESIQTQPKHIGSDTSSVRVCSPASAITSGLEDYDVNTTMFITAKNNTRHKINKQIRELLSLDTQPFGIGDLVVCRRNNYKHGVFNGQLFFVEAIDKVTPNLWLCNLRSYDDNTITDSIPIAINHFNASTKPPHHQTRSVCLFDHGYCLTCHYAQGSEFDRTVVIEPPGLGFIFRDTPSSRWRYTAATRAKTHLIYGSPYIKD